MADSSSSLLPLCERISHKSYILRIVDLTILVLLFSLLWYRILHMCENNTIWLVAFLCESCFSFMWLIITCIKWSPAEDKPYPNRLDERYNYHLHIIKKKYIKNSVNWILLEQWFRCFKFWQSRLRQLMFRNKINFNGVRIWRISNIHENWFSY